MCVRGSLFCLKTFSFYKKVVTLRCVIIVGYPIQKRVSPTHVKLMRKIRYILGTLLAFSIIEEYKAKTYNTLTLHSYHIFKRPYLFNDEGAYKGTPKRTHSQGVWLDGYSDHLPVVVYLVKQL